jgi:ribosomal protein S18 acetylase RimI-like enzyme
MFVFANDKERLWKHFQKDPVLFAYHIGDLDDLFFPQCQWATSYATRRHPIVRDVVLIYHGGSTPTVLAFGTEPDYAELVAETLDILPTRFYCHFQANCRAALESQYRLQPLGAHLKMKLAELNPVEPTIESQIVGLSQSDLPVLERLYEQAYPGNYFTPRMLETGWYRGVKIDKQLVAVAGVHVVSDQYKIAVLGNIATHPEYRGRGIARGLTGRLASELIAGGKLVGLNVKADNAAAIRCYESLGFVRVHEYAEALCERRR